MDKDKEPTQRRLKSTLNVAESAFPSEALQGALLDMCGRATARGAKAAVRAAVALYGRAVAAEHLGPRLRRLVDGLKPPKSEAAGRQLAASVASASMAARLLPDVRGTTLPL